MSVRELAELANIDKNTVTRCEAGLRVMSDSLEKLERVLVLQGAVFIGEDEIFGPGVRIRKVTKVHPDKDHVARYRQVKR